MNQWDIVKRHGRWRLVWRDPEHDWSCLKQGELFEHVRRIGVPNGDACGYYWEQRDHASKFRAALNAELREAKKAAKKAKQDRIVSVLTPTLKCPHCGKAIEVEVKGVK